MKAVVALLAFAACTSAGFVGPPAYLHAHHHHHHPTFFAAPVPVVKHVAPIYAVPPPVLVSKAVYAPPPVVLKTPIVKTVAFGPVAYGAYGLHHHDFHGHHHGHFF